ncbi:hypothetical protein [Streptomyces sp. V1I6]|uniref:hypothetical protein n=1 Tax=Streptomyces sp. V1I6 TaxID=3042273 RepID=UPI002784953A|nr:hypothetical protein [Streptomyces sp. V1I6]MDQ0845841.1 hypothetical protein [Streptomyces sp. V1I6]
MHPQTDVSGGSDPLAAAAPSEVPYTGGTAPGGTVSGTARRVVRAATEPRR